jgi:hypothetical protein
MKIAVCLSGQFRTGEHALKSALNFFQGHDCDYFCHSWQDNNMRIAGTAGFRKLIETVDTHHSKEYIQSILNEKIKPKKLIIDDHSRGSIPDNGPWSEMFYSLMIANWLKKEYEVENNFKYDLVVKTRYDFVYPPNSTFQPASYKNEPLTDHLEIFTYNKNRMYMEYSRINASDTVFYGSSNAMDIFCDIYRYLGYRNLTVNIQDMDSPGPGCLMSEFADKHNIRITSTQGVPDVIYRYDSVGLGLDVVNDYEKIAEMNWAIYK